MDMFHLICLLLTLKPCEIRSISDVIARKDLKDFTISQILLHASHQFIDVYQSKYISKINSTPIQVIALVTLWPPYAKVSPMVLCSSLSVTCIWCFNQMRGTPVRDLRLSSCFCVSTASDIFV